MSMKLVCVSVVDVGALVCSEDQFSCGRDGNVTRCIPNAHVCDGHPDCPSALDELHCKNTSLHLDFKFVLLAICRTSSLLLSLVRELNIVLFFGGGGGSAWLIPPPHCYINLSQPYTKCSV